ncbi:MAG: hypothetical protein R3190_00620 [Thermoanaerobaculia bacterium]|nr:hypothetical protein [Thermoanaerobaculia bacterium]
MRPRALNLAAIAVLAATSAAAGDASILVSRCADETSPVARRSCYEALSALGVESPGLPPEPVEILDPEVWRKMLRGSWALTVIESPLDRRPDVFLRLQADRPVRLHGREATPTLHIRCTARESSWGGHERRTEVFVDWKLPLATDYVTVLQRVDREQAALADWDPSADARAIFWKGWTIAGSEHRGEEGFVRMLMENDTLHLQVLPVAGPPLATSFSVAGLSATIGPLYCPCDW